MHRIAVKAISETIDFYALCARATAIRKEREGKEIVCEVDTSLYQLGWFNLVLELVFQDDVCWIVRLRLPVSGEMWTKETEMAERPVLKSECDTMQFVREHTTIPVPEIFECKLTSDKTENPVGYPYILMEAIPGRIFRGKFRTCIPEEHQEKVLSTIANYWIQLSTLRFPMIGRLEARMDGVDGGKGKEYQLLPILHPAGCQWPNNSGPFSTSIDYFYTTRRLDYESFLKQLPHDSEEGFMAWLRLQTAVAIVQLEFNNGPFPLYHPDLRLSNILFDEDFNVTGIIDWSFAMTAPIEAFVNLQMDFGADDVRDSFIRHMREHESHVDPNTPISNYLMSGKAAARSIVELQALAQLKEYRYPRAKILIRRLFGRSARWDKVKRLWLESELYPTSFGESSMNRWAGKILSVLLLGLFLGGLPYCWRGLGQLGTKLL